MKVIKNFESVIHQDVSSSIVTGRVTGQDLVVEPMSKAIAIVNVNFSPGARTKLHIHTTDQVVIVVDGKGILATEQEENHVTKGDLIHVPPGEVHWHGAEEDSAFSQLSIIPGGKTEVVE